MRLRGACLVAVAVAVVAAEPAQATFHLERVNEVATAVDGAQYVELLDATGEPFPIVFSPYRLVVYGADGTQVGQQTLDGPALANRTTPVLIASGAVRGQSPDIPLSIALPHDGQACFFGGGSNVHCLRYGNVTSPAPANNSDSGPAPGDGQSLQRCPGGGTAVAAPTPKAANDCTGAAAMGGGGGAQPDTIRPRAAVAVSRQTLRAVLRRGLLTRVSSNEDGKVIAQLQLSRRTARALRIRQTIARASAALIGGAPRQLRLRLASFAARRLDPTRGVTVTLSLRITDPAGNATELRRQVRLTGRP